MMSRNKPSLPSTQTGSAYFILLITGFALRLHRLGDASLWYDETVSAFLASQSVPDLVAHTARDIHPPGYYLLLHGWTRLAGNSEFALAFFALIFGMLLIALTYRLAHHLANRQVALWAAGLVALSPYQLWYSQEVRMYTLAATLGLVTAWQLWVALDKGGWRPWLIAAISAILGLYVLYYFAFLLLALNLWAIVWHRTRWRAMMRFNLGILSGYAPWLPILWRQATNPPVPPWREMTPLWPLLHESLAALSVGQTLAGPALWLLLAVTLLLYALGVLYLARRVSALLALYTLAPLLLIYGLSYLTPLYHVRYVFVYSPAFYILLGAGFVWLSHRWRYAPLIPALVLLGAFSLSIDNYHRLPTDDYRAAVNFIDAQYQPGDALLVNAGYVYPAFVYYTNRHPLERQRLVPYASPTAPTLWQTGTVDGSANLGWGLPESDFYAMRRADTRAALDRLAADYPRVWLLRAYDTVTDPDGVIRAWLDEHAILIEDRAFPGETNLRVQGYLLPQGDTRPSQPLTRFEDGMALTAWTMPASASAGESILVRLWWQTTASPGVDYKMSLKLWQPDGSLAAQGQDTWPAGTLYRATAWPTGQPVYHPARLHLPADLAPGQYWLNVELYHPETVQPLPLESGDAAVTLGPLRVD